MSLKIRKRDIIPFFSFLLITLGNGVYISNKYGDMFEYLGVLFLSVLSLFSLRKIKIKDCFKILIFVLILSLGCFVFDNTSKTRFMIISTSIIISILSTCSGSIINSNKRIKLVITSIFTGIIINTIIGFITGSVGITIHDGIIGILFLCGFSVKNYCGGIWMVLFILNYTFYMRENKLNSRKCIYALIINIIFLILSGSKGACILCIIFIFAVNYSKFVNLKLSQKRLFSFIILICSIVFGVYVYKNILINIDTYAFRMRGFENLLNYLLSDFRRFIFGMSDIAYANNNRTYVYNIRNFLGWESSVEMAYVNILIKNGIIGYIPYICIFKKYLKNIKNLKKTDRYLLFALIIMMLVSGFVETYIVSIHYVVGPVLYCLLNGLIEQNEGKVNENKCNHSCL